MFFFNGCALLETAEGFTRMMLLLLNVFTFKSLTVSSTETSVMKPNFAFVLAEVALLGLLTKLLYSKNDLKNRKKISARYQ